MREKIDLKKLYENQEELTRKAIIAWAELPKKPRIEDILKEIYEPALDIWNNDAFLRSLMKGNVLVWVNYYRVLMTQDQTGIPSSVKVKKIL